MVSRVVNALLSLVGAYVIVVYALWSPFPLSGLDMFLLPIPSTQPNNYVAGAVTVVIAEVALLVGLVSMVRRSARREASLVLAQTGAYLLALRIIYPPVIPYVGTPANVVYVSPPEPALAWVSLAVGIVAVLVGVAGFFGAVHGAGWMQSTSERERAA